MTSEKLAIDPSLAAVLGTSDALSQALACVRAAMLAINDGVELKVDHFSLLKCAEDIIESRMEIIEKAEDVLGDLQSQSVDAQQSGYQAARSWYADMLGRIEALDSAYGLSGYCVDSKLRGAFEALSVDQRGAFLDAVGDYLVTFIAIGQPSESFLVDADRLRMHASTPEEQDAWADACEHAEQDAEGDIALASSYAGGQS
ncbi:MAG: hypothetical protein EPN46_02410 [Candidimonas sp.]|nr:MAG: hypothetical protein EPN77_05290 [Candidimonas sp.]TAM22297.1 MAG: hypothetical protein EPN62_12260 [Candidimonas sp.]TAM80185.1 MAG: hypothetical protein EPN46_02410 [Candidimonas sp.]